jgi:hypothetical protein
MFKLERKPYIINIMDLTKIKINSLLLFKTIKQIKIVYLNDNRLRVFPLKQKIH